MLTHHCGRQVVNHFENPRNVGTLDKKSSSVGTGLVGAPACGGFFRARGAVVLFILKMAN